MTVRTQRRLAVLALALGLIAAAPYVFDGVVDYQPFFVDRLHGCVFVGRVTRARTPWPNGRVLDVRIGMLATEYHSEEEWSILKLRGPRGSYQCELPPESITLRVACAFALAGVWGLVVCIRALGRSWRRVGTN